jgi:site-specific recombinase XerC
MRLMGHRNVATTDVYVYANYDKLRRAVELAQKKVKRKVK